MLSLLLSRFVLIFPTTITRLLAYKEPLSTTTFFNGELYIPSEGVESSLHKLATVVSIFSKRITDEER
jgi:hypothetical protein